FFSSRRRHTRFSRDWSSDVCSSDLHVSDCYTQTGWAQWRPQTHPPPAGNSMGKHGEKIIFWPSKKRADPGNDTPLAALRGSVRRSEERRVGKECRSRRAAAHGQQRL